MRRLSFILLLGWFFLPCAVRVCAQDSITVEKDELSDLRHPLPIHLNISGPQKAPMATSCPTDSMITKGHNGETTAQKYYQYDAAGHTTAEISYAWNGGVKSGVSRYKKVYTGSVATTTVNYSWDAASGVWVGLDSTQLLYFANGLQSAQEMYVWENGAWRINTKYEYEYAADNRQTLSRYSIWSATAQNLVYSNQWVWTYENKAVDEAYWLYSNNAWVGNSRTLKDYDAAGNQILEERYSGWENNTWKGASKYTAQFNSAKKETEHITYKWKSGAWVENIKMTKDYDGDNEIDNATYVWSNGWVGNSRTTKTYSGTLVTNEISWLWDATNAQWVSNTQTATVYTGNKVLSQTNTVWDGAAWTNVSQLTNTYESSNLIESNTYAWRNEAWSDSLRTINTFDAKGINTLSVSDAWNGTAWIPTDSVTREVIYITVAGKELVQEDVTMSWKASTGKWIGENRKTNIYDDWGNVIQSDTYSYVAGKGWINNVRRQYAYKDGNKKLETLNAYLMWNNAKKVWSGTTKTEKVYDDTNRLVKTSTYKWNATHNDWEGLSSNEDVYENGIKVTNYSYKWDATNWEWIGMFKHDYVYSATGKIEEQTDWRYNTTTGWYYDTRVTNVYDSQNRVILNENFQWISAENRWCTSTSTQTNYDTEAEGGRLRSQLLIRYAQCVETSYALDNYYYACDPHGYTICFINYNGVELQSGSVEQGVVPEYTGATPTKPANDQYTYIFKGWTPAIVAVTSNAMYVADYDSTLNSYLITFKNYDGTVLQSGNVEYGQVPAYAQTPEKPATEQYTYTFKGWTPEVAEVSDEATYVAEYDSTLNSYLITFKNYDGTVLQSGDVAYGAMPQYIGETPNKLSNAQYTYIFKGWTPAIVAVTGEATYVAEYDSTLNSYLITFKNYDGTVLQSGNVEYGQVPAYAQTPEKPTTAQYTYIFKGWTPAIVAVTGEATYVAEYDSTLNSYLITFKNYDGTVLQSGNVEYGQVPAHAQTPEKLATAQYTYTFKGWTPQIAEVTGEATYIAQFDSVINSYTVIFYYEDRETVLDSMTLAYGETPSTTAVPSKLSDMQYTYHFAGWSPEIAPVTGDVSYTPVYDAVLNQYVITFENYNGIVLKTTMTDYGTIPEYTGETPTKPATAQYSYVFAGWTPELTEVTGAATYTAIFESELNVYTITFFDEDGTQLDQVIVEYGTMPTTDVIPTKPEDEEYTYTFAGWTPRLVKVTSDASYWATYTATKKTNGLSPVTGNPSPVTVKVMIDGHIYIRRGTHLYTLDGVLVD